MLTRKIAEKASSNRLAIACASIFYSRFASVMLLRLCQTASSLLRALLIEALLLSFDGRGSDASQSRTLTLPLIGGLGFVGFAVSTLDNCGRLSIADTSFRSRKPPTGILIIALPLRFGGLLHRACAARHWPSAMLKRKGQPHQACSRRTLKP